MLLHHFLLQLDFPTAGEKQITFFPGRGGKNYLASLNIQEEFCADEDLEDLSEGKGATVDEELANLSAAATASATDEEEDDALSYFQKLAEE